MFFFFFLFAFINKANNTETLQVLLLKAIDFSVAHLYGHAFLYLIEWRLTERWLTIAVTRSPMTWNS